MEEARHCKARSATLARSSSEKLGAVLQRDIIIVINVLTQRGLIVLVSRFISPSRWIVKSLTKRDIYIKKKKNTRKRDLISSRFFFELLSRFYEERIITVFEMIGLKKKKKKKKDV